MRNLFVLVRTMRSLLLGSSAVLTLAFCMTSFAVSSATYVCDEQQRVIITQVRGAAGASCIGKPYDLVCTDDGRYGCCKSACECIFRGQVFLDKGWGGGARNLTSYSITESCPVIKNPGVTLPPGSDRVEQPLKSPAPAAPLAPTTPPTPRKP
jgi:hypothetical protein